MAVANTVAYNNYGSNYVHKKIYSTGAYTIKRFAAVMYSNKWLIL